MTKAVNGLRPAAVPRLAAIVEVVLCRLGKKVYVVSMHVPPKLEAEGALLHLTGFVSISFIACEHFEIAFAAIANYGRVIPQGSVADVVSQLLKDRAVLWDSRRLPRRRRKLPFIEIKPICSSFWVSAVFVAVVYVPNVLANVSEPLNRALSTRAKTAGLNRVIKLNRAHVESNVALPSLLVPEVPPYVAYASSLRDPYSPFLSSIRLASGAVIQPYGC